MKKSRTFWAVKCPQVGVSILRPSDLHRTRVDAICAIEALHRIRWRLLKAEGYSAVLVEIREVET